MGRVLSGCSRLGSFSRLSCLLLIELLDSSLSRGEGSTDSNAIDLLDLVAVSEIDTDIKDVISVVAGLDALEETDVNARAREFETHSELQSK